MLLCACRATVVQSRVIAGVALPSLQGCVTCAIKAAARRRMSWASITPGCPSPIATPNGRQLASGSTTCAAAVTRPGMLDAQSSSSTGAMPPSFSNKGLPIMHQGILGDQRPHGAWRSTCGPTTETGRLCGRLFRRRQAACRSGQVGKSLLPRRWRGAQLGCMTQAQTSAKRHWPRSRMSREHVGHARTRTWRGTICWTSITWQSHNGFAARRSSWTPCSCGSSHRAGAASHGPRKFGMCELSQGGTPSSVLVSGRSMARSARCRLCSAAVVCSAAPATARRWR